MFILSQFLFGSERGRQWFRRPFCFLGGFLQHLGSIGAAVMVILASGGGGWTLGAADEVLDKARAAFEKGDREAGLSLLGKALEANPKDQRALYYRARIHESGRDYAKAIKDYDVLLTLNPISPNFHDLRGGAHFKAGQIAESIRDFDKSIELAPSREPHHWQRGISYYYAKRFEEGRKQFEVHQTVNSNDVENAVWHFLCVARRDGFEKARASLIPIEGDARTPMMQVQALFAGKGSADQVLAAATAGNPSPAELRNRLFYAHLYLGLFYEASGDEAKAKEHITKAAREFDADHYMGDVARVHAKLRFGTAP